MMAHSERVALYLRVSGEDQRERATIELQREFLEQYRELYGLEIAGVYADDGLSGTVALHERPEGRRLLSDAREGRFGAVLVYRLDRLGRSLLVIVEAHDRLQEAGVALRSATEPIDTSTPSGRLIFQMLASFAEFERGTIRERTQAGLHRALRNGKHSGRIPYGYTLAPDERGLEVVPEEAAVVREIITNVADGATLYGESKRLNDEGIPSPGWRFKSGERKHGAGWSPSTIAGLVHQGAYSGLHRVKAGEEFIEREVPAIVEPGLQRRAEVALEQNKRRASAARQGARRYLLSGLVRCETCGHACNGRTSTSYYRGKASKYRYYGCTANRRERGPDRTVQPHRPPHVRAPWLEELVWTDVKRFVTNPGEVLERVREQLQDDSGADDLSARLEGLQTRLAAKQGEKDRYVRLYAQGHIEEGELETYLSDVSNQIANLRLMVEAAAAEASQHRERLQAADTTVAWLNLLRERADEIEEDTPEAFNKRQQIVRLLVEGVTLGRDDDGETTVEVTYRFGPADDTADLQGVFVGDVQNSFGNLAANRNPSGATSRQFCTVERRGVP
jgi:site-specific DNA recombinase